MVRVRKVVNEEMRWEAAAGGTARPLSMVSED